MAERDEFGRRGPNDPKVGSSVCIVAQQHFFIVCKQSFGLSWPDAVAVSCRAENQQVHKRAPLTWWQKQRAERLFCAVGNTAPPFFQTKVSVQVPKLPPKDPSSYLAGATPVWPSLGLAIQRAAGLYCDSGSVCADLLLVPRRVQSSDGSICWCAAVSCTVAPSLAFLS